MLSLRVLHKRQISFTTLLKKLVPLSESNSLGAECLQTIHSMNAFAVVSAVKSVKALASTQRVRYSVKTIMYLFPLYVKGKGPKISVAILQKVLLL